MLSKLLQPALQRCCMPADAGLVHYPCPEDVWVLQIYPRLYVSGSMYEGRWWRALVTGWEWVVSSPLAVLLPCVLVGMLAWRLCGAR